MNHDYPHVLANAWRPDGKRTVLADLVGHYLEPLARDLHNMTAAQSVPTTVWASPYYVGNMTRHNASNLMTPQFYADWWGQLFSWAPHLDLIAPQDSMGAQGNSFANVSTFLALLAGSSRAASRRVFSNVELFEVWPRGCQYTPHSAWMIFHLESLFYSRVSLLAA